MAWDGWICWLTNLPENYDKILQTMSGYGMYKEHDMTSKSLSIIESGEFTKESRAFIIYDKLSEENKAILKRIRKNMHVKLLVLSSRPTVENFRRGTRDFRKLERPDLNFDLNTLLSVVTDEQRRLLEKEVMTLGSKGFGLFQLFLNLEVK